MFEWNDEWWKVYPPDSHDPYGWSSGGFPDGTGNEEYFGIVDIDRVPREVYYALRDAFAPAYAPAPQPVTFSAISQGTASVTPPDTCGYAELRKGATRLYRGYGCSFTGARGFNIVTIDPASGRPLGPVRNYDTYNANPFTGEPWLTMIDFLNSVPAGAIILIAVGDEAGLNSPDSCVRRSGAGIEQGLQALEALGSSQIRSYCYRGSWAMVTVKGEGIARSEQRSQTGAATAQAAFSLP